MSNTIRHVLFEGPTRESLFLELCFGDTILSTATGFVVSAGKSNLLITARHVFTGRHAVTGEPLSANSGIPDSVVIYHNGVEKDARGCDTVVKIKQKLIAADHSQLWIEHPEFGKDADIAALLLKESEKFLLMPVDVGQHKNPISCRPSEMVSIVGYPLGATVPGGHAIWSTGFMASELDIYWKGNPVFLVDSRTRQGQSGSPVFSYRIGPCLRSDGTISYSGYEAASYNFLGVYSGRIHKDSDIGQVWNASSVRELINHATDVLNA